MFRLAASKLAKRGLSRASATGARSWAVPTASSYHSSVPRREEEKKDDSADVAPSSGGGINPLYGIPVGVALAVPILEYQWFIPNEETLLASTLLGFCVVMYTQGGETIANMFKDEANDMLKAQNEAEDKVIAKLEESVEYMKLTENVVSDYQAIMDLTESSYAKLNASGKIKPQHVLKAQMEKILSMIAAEEQNMYEKAKLAMMAEATEAVTAEFASSKELQKSAVTSAIAKLTGKAGKDGADPVKDEFVKFFQQKGAAAKKADGAAEEQQARESLLTKLNAAAENDNMYFRFNVSTGKPHLVDMM